MDKYKWIIIIWNIINMKFKKDGTRYYKLKSVTIGDGWVIQENESHAILRQIFSKYN